MLTGTSLSEYGCNKNQRAFEEVASLYSNNMTPVYSGGLVYEYSQEDTHYGLVEISGNSVSELDDYGRLKKALAGTPAPQGDGGYKSDGKASDCPAKSSTWAVDNVALPAIPDKAKQYLQQGAGKGPGLNGPGSQEAGSPSSGDAQPGSGTVTTSGSASPSKGAAGALKPLDLGVAPVACALALLLSAALGTSLL